MSDRLSSAIGVYNVHLHCAKPAPFCWHRKKLDLEAFIAEHGDMTDDDLRRNARCEKCGHRGATLIITPVHTGPSWNDPRRPNE